VSGEGETLNLQMKTPVMKNHEKNLVYF